MYIRVCVPQALGIINTTTLYGPEKHEGMFSTLIMQDVIRFILRRLHVNMEHSVALFGLQLKHAYSHEYYWLQPGFTIFELLDTYCTTKPADEWR